MFVFARMGVQFHRMNAGLILVFNVYPGLVMLAILERLVVAALIFITEIHQRSIVYKTNAPAVKVLRCLTISALSTTLKSVLTATPATT